MKSRLRIAIPFLPPIHVHAYVMQGSVVGDTTPTLLWIQWTPMIAWKTWWSLALTTLCTPVSSITDIWFALISESMRSYTTCLLIVVKYVKVLNINRINMYKNTWNCARYMYIRFGLVYFLSAFRLCSNKRLMGFKSYPNVYQTKYFPFLLIWPQSSFLRLYEPASFIIHIYLTTLLKCELFLHSFVHPASCSREWSFLKVISMIYSKTECLHVHVYIEFNGQWRI